MKSFCLTVHRLYQRNFVIFRLGLLLTGVMTGHLSTQAQSVFSPVPVEPKIPAAIQPASTPTTAPAPEEGTPIQWGSVTLRPRFTYQLLHGDGILASPSQSPVTTTMQSTTLGLQLNLGTHWILDYSPSYTAYTATEFDDTLSQTISLSGGAVYDKLRLQLFQNYEKSSEPLIQTGQQTDQTSYATALTASYRLGEHMSLDSVVNQQVLLLEIPSPTTRNWYFTERLNYKFTERTSAGLGVDVGYVSVDPGADISYVRSQLQLVWQATPKLSFNLSGGVENRKFRSGPAPDISNPSYSGVITYQPFENTRITFYTVRAFAASYLIGQMPESTRWNIVLDQQLFKNFHLHTGYAEEDIDYIPTSVVPVGRADKSYLYNARLSTKIFRRLTITALYQHRTLNSSLPNFSFSGSYTGFEIGYQY